MAIMPIKLLPDKTTLKERENIEEACMLQLNTVFPYGLNVRVKKKNILDACNIVMNSKTTIYSQFDIVKINRHSRGGRFISNIVSDRQEFDIDVFYEDLLDDDKMIDMHDIRTNLCNLKKKQLKLVYIKAISYINNFNSSITTYRFHKILLVKDLSWFYLTRMGLACKDSKKSNSFIVVNYVNKFVEYIDFRKIFKMEQVTKAAPFKSKSHQQPTLSYKYPPTIRSKVLNYKKVYNEANIDSETLKCNCASSRYIDPTHKHVITGELSMISNDKLRNLLMKGLNYRDQAKPCTEKALKSVKMALKNYCDKLSNLWHKPIEEFQEWKTLIIEQVKIQLQGAKPYPYYSVLSDVEVLADLDELHKEFVLVPTDKAKNNITIVCKKFYISMIEKELSSDTFNKVNRSEDSVIDEHREFLLKHGI